MAANDLFVKQEVDLHEFNMHMAVYNMGIVNTPRIYRYDHKNRTMSMDRVENMNVADYHGEAFSVIPVEVIERIRATIRTLYEHGFVYPDITGYNFIEANDRIWVIDFEHAQYRAGLPDDHRHVQFVEAFIGGAEMWNPEFL